MLVRTRAAFACWVESYAVRPPQPHARRLSLAPNRPTTRHQARHAGNQGGSRSGTLEPLRRSASPVERARPRVSG